MATRFDVAPGGPPRGRAVRRVLVGVLAAVGSVALLLVLGVALIAEGLEADRAGPRSAADGLAADLRALPGVRSAVVEPGYGDLGTAPVDLYAEVRLAAGCDSAVVHADAARLRRTIANEPRFQLHPTLWCAGRAITVSPRADITARRLALFDVLVADRTLERGAILVRQRGDDPSPDLDDAAATVELHLAGGPVGRTARRWSERIARMLPGAGLEVGVAAASADGDVDARLPVAGTRWIGIVPTDPRTGVLLETATGLDRLGIDGYVVTGGAGTSGSIEIVLSGPASLRRIADLLQGGVPDGCAVSVRIRAR